MKVERIPPTLVDDIWDAPSERLTYEEFKAKYASKSGDKNFLDATTDDFAPFVTENATYFQKLNAAIGQIREEHLDTVIGNTLNEPGVQKILVVYGGGHRTISEPVWEAALGKGVDINPAQNWSQQRRNQPTRLNVTEITR